MEEQGDTVYNETENPTPMIVEHIDRKGRRVFRLKGMKKQTPGLKTRPKYLAEDFNFNIFNVWRAVVLECMATALFVFFATGSVVAVNTYPDQLVTAAANVLAAVIQGYSIATLVYAVAHTTGGHLNPAVTLSLMTSGHIGFIRGFLYIASQVIGGIIGSGLLKAVIPSSYERTLGATDISKGVTPGIGFLLEFILTFMLLFTIFGTAINTQSTTSGSHVLAPLPIGFAVTIGVVIAYSFTGGSLNPARSFGPAVVQGIWTAHWIYWAGPMGAGLVVGLLERYVFLVQVSDRKKEDSPNKVETATGNRTGRVQTRQDLKEIEGEEEYDSEDEYVSEEQFFDDVSSYYAGSAAI